MSSLRNILQRCASRNSILSGTPLQIQCTFNPVYSAYPTSISRQTYSSDANETPKNWIDPVRKYFLELVNSRKSRSKITVPGDQKESKSFTADSAQKTPFGQIHSKKSPPNVTEDQKLPKAPIFNKNLNLRQYYIRVSGLSINTTPESLREFYSQFGEIAFCDIKFPGEAQQFGSVAFLKQEAMNRALNSLPHCIDGKETKNVVLDKKHLTLKVLDLSPKTTTESLRKFYSRFGYIKCKINQGANDNVGEVTFANHEDMHHALDAQPHVIDESEVFLKYATTDLDFLIPDVPDGITEEELIAFYSKYGQLRRCRLFKGKTGILHASLSFSAIDGVNRAMEDRPHIINGKPLQMKFLGNGHSNSVSLFVGSLPENVTEETLRQEFAKYGNLVFWKIENDGRFNQSGPYGIVMYGSEEEVLNALNSGPHTIEGAVVDVRIAKEAIKSLRGKEESVGTDKNTLRKTIEIRDVPEGVTEEELIAFYSKYGRVEECRLGKGKTGILHAFVSYSAISEVNRAIDDRPHIIGGKPMQIRFMGKGHSLPVSLFVGSLPENVTEETLREEFSKYGKPVFWELKNDGDFNQSRPYGIVKYGSEEEALNVLNSGPHTIKGAVVDVRIANEANKSLSGKEKSIGTDENTLRKIIEIRDVPEGVTKEDLIAFYSKYGRVEDCRLRKGKTGIPHAYVSYSAVDEVNRAMDDRPHIIGGKSLKIKINAKRHSESHNTPVSLFVGSLPETVTEETLREEFSKYGKPVFWKLENDGRFNESGPYGIVKYGSEEEALKVLNSGPHTIEGAVVDVRKAKDADKSLPGKEKSIGTDKNTLTFEIKDLPEGVTEEDLIAFYSKYGRVEECQLRKGKTGIPHAFVSYFAVDEINLAIADRPHIIDGKPLEIQFLGNTGRHTSVSLFVGSLPENVTKETLRKEFSKYGKPVFWELKNDGQFNQSGPYGIVKYGSEEEALNALNSGPHTIEGSVVDVRKAKDADKSLPGKEKSIGTDKNTLRKTFEIRYLPEGVTEEELIAFYSKYGRVEDCRLRKGKTGILYAFVSFSTIDEMNRAMDDRPHIIGGKPLQIQSRDHSIRISLFVGSLPENFTEETLREEFSKYGKPVYWALKNDGQFGQTGPYGIVKYATDQEALNALNNGSNANLHFKPLISAQETRFEEIDSIKSPTVTKDQKVSKPSTVNKTDSMNSRPNVKSRPSVTKNQKPSKAPTFNKKRNLRKYYIHVRNSWMGQKASKSKIVEDQKESKAPT